MILHGIYDHGKITIKEKDIPQVQSDVEIVFINQNADNSNESIESDLLINKIAIETKTWKFNREEIYSNE